jgi:aspartate-semialdehyde dehydrogenase
MTNTNKKKVGAVLGCTGIVGREILKEYFNDPLAEIKITAASPRSARKTFDEAIADKNVPEAELNRIPQHFRNSIVRNLHDVDEIASQVDFVYSAFDMDKDETIALEEAYAKKGVYVISNNSACRWKPDVPLIVAEVNIDHLDILPYQNKRLGTNKGGIVAKPNCSLQSYIAHLDAIMDLTPYDINVSLMQAISGSGKYVDQFPDVERNVVPLIGEAEKSEKEPLKIFGKIENGEIISNKELQIHAVSYRVRALDGHIANVFFKLRDPHISKLIENNQSEAALHIIKEKFKKYNPLVEDNLPLSPEQVINYLGDKEYPTPLKDAMNQNGMEFTYGGLKLNPRTGVFQFTGMTNNRRRGAGIGGKHTLDYMIKNGYIK